MSQFFLAVSTNAKYEASTSDYWGSFSPTRMYTFKISDWVDRLSGFLVETHRKPQRAELEADVLAWVIAISTSAEAVNEALRAVAGAKQSEKLRIALCQRPVTEKLCKILENCFHLTASVVTVRDAPLAEVCLLAMSRVLSPRTDNLVDKEYLAPFKTLLHVERPIHRLDSLDPCVKTLGWAVHIGIWINMDDDGLEVPTGPQIQAVATMGAAPYERRTLMTAAIDGALSQKKGLRATCEELIMGYWDLSRGLFDGFGKETD
ncbi:hypothetical protein BU17DRAFT_98974 [Hysterangium stoloniferum]|nr:hypothetical protein BU17DRAFT_98974 [Hysterangium stoloniferum]